MRFFAVRGKRGSGGDSPRTWIKSSLSSYNGNCVEVAGLADNIIRVRDSKHPRGGMLNFTTAEWDAFLGGVRNGEFDRQGPQLGIARTKCVVVGVHQSGHPLVRSGAPDHDKPPREPVILVPTPGERIRVTL